jgi:multidrug efflux system membrane fusion protein
MLTGLPSLPAPLSAPLPAPLPPALPLPRNIPPPHLSNSATQAAPPAPFSMKPRNILLFLIALFIGLGVAAWHWKTQQLQKQATEKAALKERAAQPVPTLLATATVRDVPVWLASKGTVIAYNTVTVRPRVSGLLDSVNFTEGQLVSKGDVLGQIDPRPYRAVLEQAVSKKAQNAAILKNATLERARIKSLVDEDAESQRVLDEAETRVAELEARTKEDTAAVAAAQLDLDFTTLRSPIDGRTGLRQLDAGNTVTANQATGLVVVTQTQPIFVKFSLPSKHLTALRPAALQNVRPFPVEAVSDDSGEVLGKGVLSLLDNLMDTDTDNITLKATFKNEDGALWPGQYVEARLLVRTLKGVVVVPSEAVQPGIDDSPMVYIANADNTVTPRDVVRGHDFVVRTAVGAAGGVAGATAAVAGEFVVIEKGLAAGERVVREGHNRLKPGTKINPIEKAKPPATAMPPATATPAAPAAAAAK